MSVVNKIIKLLLGIPIAVILILMLIVNDKIHYSPEERITGHDSINYDLLKELRGLKNSLHENADIEMQHRYPEGYIFLNAVYGLAWCNFMEGLDRESEYFKEGHAEIQRTFNKIDSDIGRSSFNEDLSLSYGAFYTGWSTYLLGRKLYLEPLSKRKEGEVAYFKQKCESIASSVNEKIYPESYYGSAWPADVVLCMATLALHDKLFGPHYSEAIKNWLSKVKTKLDIRGLIPHSSNPEDGVPIENARGSSQSLMLVFLHSLDKEFAQEQFAIYKTNFVDSKFGLTGIREYAKDDLGAGDVDSGPIILQFGSAATIVGMQTLSLYGEVEMSLRIRNAIEAFGFPFKKGDQKTYLFGLLPMADAFITWANSVEAKQGSSPPSFTTFHTYSVFIFIILLAFLYILLKIRNS